jgi:hypothetical protein
MVTVTAHQTRSADATCDRGGSITRSLLGYGVLAGPLYLVVGFTQALSRDGFDLGRHPFSLLSNGHLGWIQITNFLVTGLMTVACALGARRVLGSGPGGTWGPRLVAAYGAGLVCAGLFLADPADGFPRGAPDGQPDVSWHGALHLASFSVGFSCLTAACFVLARGFAASGHTGSATRSRVAGYLILGSVAVSFATSGSAAAVVALYVAVVTAWAWLAGTSLRLYRQAPATPPV